MKLDPNEPAYPTTQSVTFEGHLCRLGDDDCRIESTGGLTIRAEFAKAAITGAATTPDGKCYPSEVAKAALALADAMIAELNKEESK